MSQEAAPVLLLTWVSLSTVWLVVNSWLKLCTRLVPVSVMQIQCLSMTTGLMDVTASATCPPAIADWKPAILIVDNDFKVDTVSRKATGAHWTNVMFVQPENYEKKPNEEPPAKIAKRDIFAQLKGACHDMAQVRQYRCPPGSKIEPPALSRIELPLNGTFFCRALALWYTELVGQIIPKQDHHLMNSWSQHTVVPSPVTAHYPLRVNPTNIWFTMSRLANQCWLTSWWS